MLCASAEPGGLSAMTTPRDPERARRRPLTSDELADAEEQFDECDADGDQRIDFTEYSQLLDNLGAEVPPAKRRNRFNAIDTDRDGAIDRSEFMAWWGSSGA
jgi:Ca2+-binding EF-hand superfamily protein